MTQVSRVDQIVFTTTQNTNTNGHSCEGHDHGVVVDQIMFIATQTDSNVHAREGHDHGVFVVQIMFIATQTLVPAATMQIMLTPQAKASVTSKTIRTSSSRS